MLKERVKDLMGRYEWGEVYLSAYDVQDELEEIMEEEPWDDELSPKLQDAINKFILHSHEAARGGGRIPDYSDEFIKEIEEIIDYEE